MKEEKDGVKKCLSILIINNYFPPEIGAASHLYYYLAKNLVKRGHSVTILTGIPRYNVSRDLYERYLTKFGGKRFIIENDDGIEIIRVKLPFVERSQLIRRGLEHFEIAFKMFFYTKKLLKERNIDVSLVYSPPLSLYWSAYKIKNLKEAPFILNVQDLFPQAAIDLGAIRNPILIRFFRYLEKIAYKKADIITVHSERNKIFVESVVKQSGKVLVMENWVDENEIVPGKKENDFSIKHNLTGKFVVSFAGTLGFSQDAEVILKAASELRDYKDIVFVIVGDGVGIKEAKLLINELQLTNVLLIPPVPREEYPLVLNSSDISLATLKNNVRTPVVPSKILSIMSAGIPVVASMNLDGDAPELIKKANAGFCVPAGDYKALSEKILLLYKTPSLRETLGKNGRKYIEEHLSSGKAAEKYEQLFFEILSNKRRQENGLSEIL
ncbi:MAG: hypothetical protein PWQ73_248 [Petrotoga sp.]|nr:hypothetical protein [Petrotoga sp.]